MGATNPRVADNAIIIGDRLLVDADNGNIGDDITIDPNNPEGEPDDALVTQVDDLAARADGFINIYEHVSGAPGDATSCRAAVVEFLRKRRPL